MKIEFDGEKNRKLMKFRRIGFEDVIAKIADNSFLDDIKHPKYGHQRILIIEHEKYVYAVPYVKTTSGIFLKTIYPSRRFTDKYLRSKK